MYTLAVGYFMAARCFHCVQGKEGGEEGEGVKVALGAGWLVSCFHSDLCILHICGGLGNLISGGGGSLPLLW